jgi:hypothetical protein
MLISKDQFLHFANRYRNCCVEQDALHSALSPFIERPIITYGQKALDGLQEMLVCMSECEDEDDIFWWWVHEDVDKKITVQNAVTGDVEVFDVESAEGLYEYLYYMYHSED